MSRVNKSELYLKTTVVGSFPCQPSREMMIRSYFDHSDPFLNSIKQSIEKQIDAKIDIISDGQTRGGMVESFASKIPGFRMKKKPVIVSELYYEDAITLPDILYALQFVDTTQIKGILTGPYTLRRFSINDYYKTDQEAAFAIAEILNKEARILQGHVAIIQVDEPFFSVEYPEYAAELIDTVFKNISIPRALHVCGRVEKIFPKLIEFDIDILDHEFAQNPELLDYISEYDFSQMIGYGCVRNDIENVETWEEIYITLKKASELLDYKNLIIDPDCGLRHLTQKTAYLKLKNMVKARDKLIQYLEREGIA